MRVIHIMHVRVSSSVFPFGSKRQNHKDTKTKPARPARNCQRRFYVTGTFTEPPRPSLHAYPRHHWIRPSLPPTPVVPPEDLVFVPPWFVRTTKDNQCSYTRSARSTRSTHKTRIYAARRGAFARLFVGGARAWVSSLEDWHDKPRRYLEHEYRLAPDLWTVRDNLEAHRLEPYHHTSDNEHSESARQS